MEKNSTLNHLAAVIPQEKLKTEELGMTPGNSQPSQLAISNILNYSKALSVQKTKKRGFLEFILN
jgi:hypothetical protein